MTKGAVPVWADTDTTDRRHRYRPGIVTGSYSPDKEGVSMTMNSTALKESWKLMSKRAEGLATNMKKAATPNELRAELSRPKARHTAITENIMSERVMETGIPMENAYDHIMAITMSSLTQGLNRKDGKRRYRIQHIIPTCSPETART